MAEKLDLKEMVSFEELLMVNIYQADAIAQLLIDKGIITQDEFYNKLKEVKAQWQKKGN